ncbi:MAG: RHS repeat-associated core domain-containing protein, partial [Bacteroidales bacterium]|nr:RHS repeat-associated core domain-containing protein [Bacteroidales bacterium]
EKPTISLLQYAKAFAASANVKYKTKDSYRLMCGHLEKYGDIPIDKVTTSYLQDFILNLQTMYEYDPAGHLTRETNPLGQIFYHYTYYRLAHKRYSDMTENNVTYSYGDVGRATGRPVRIVDGSGVQTFEYDALGNVSKSIRVLSVPASGYAYAFTHNFEYDSWGRIWSMTYPDGERVDYRYNHAGDLTLMTGDKWGNPRTYIADILYTKYGQRKRIDYGNGTHTEYAYDSLQRLAFLHSEDISHNPMQHTEYSYNKVGNITGLANNAGGIGGMGGLYSNSYYYDPLGRLVASNGSGDIGGQPRDYAMEEMQYSPSGRIGTKHLLWQSVTTRGMQHMEYFYSNSNDKPHAPRLIVNNATGGLYDLVWDGAGNLVRMAVRNEPAVDYSNRILHWTEDNRLFAVADESHFSYYAYDHNGERTLKMTGDAATVDQNALGQHVFTSLNHVTLYPSPYIVLTEQGYTKHYYAGANRLAARLGSGGLSRDTSCVRSNENLVRRTDELFRHSCERVNSFNYRNHEELELVRIDGSIFDSVFEFDRNAASRHLYADVKPRPGAIHNLIVSHSTHNTRSAPTPEEPDVYFYHSDHLGSASWITNAAGMPIQHLQYLPFGERFVDQRSTGYSERFTFTGKERDEETGYGYFGARYMDHELMTSFISVDRYADKYPFISPYAYCLWNPIQLTDPTGDTVVITGDHELVEKALSLIRLKSNNLYFSLEDGGQLKAFQRGEGLTAEEAYMLEIINSTEVKVNLRVLDKNCIAPGYGIDYGGGSYCGNILRYNTADNVIGVDAMQAININTISKFDKLLWSTGELIWHEISEAYEGGLIAINTKQESPPSNRTSSTYFSAHCAASSHFLGDIDTDCSKNPTVAVLYNKCEIVKQ